MREVLERRRLQPLGPGCGGLRAHDRAARASGADAGRPQRRPRAPQPAPSGLGVGSGSAARAAGGARSWKCSARTSLGACQPVSPTARWPMDVDLWDAATGPSTPAMGPRVGCGAPTPGRRRLRSIRRIRLSRAVQEWTSGDTSTAVAISHGIPDGRHQPPDQKQCGTDL